MIIQYKKYRKNYKIKVLDMVLNLEDEWRNTMFQLLHSISQCSNNYEKIYLALSEGKVIGLVYGYILKNGTLLPQFLYVDKAYRDKGIASELLDRLERSSNCTCSLVWYHKSLSEFYRKQKPYL